MIEKVRGVESEDLRNMYFYGPCASAALCIDCHPELAVADLAILISVHSLDHIVDLTGCQLGIVGKISRSKLHFAINITINVNKMAHLRWHLHLAREVVHHKLELISWDATCASENY